MRCNVYIIVYIYKIYIYIYMGCLLAGTQYIKWFAMLNEYMYTLHM